MIWFILFLTKSRGCPEDRLLYRKTGSKPDDRQKILGRLETRTSRLETRRSRLETGTSRLPHSVTGSAAGAGSASAGGKASSPIAAKVGRGLSPTPLQRRRLSWSGAS